MDQVGDRRERAMSEYAAAMGVVGVGAGGIRELQTRVRVRARLGLRRGLRARLRGRVGKGSAGLEACTTKGVGLRNFARNSPLTLPSPKRPEGRGGIQAPPYPLRGQPLLASPGSCGGRRVPRRFVLVLVLVLVIVFIIVLVLVLVIGDWRMEEGGLEEKSRVRLRGRVGGAEMAHFRPWTPK